MDLPTFVQCPTCPLKRRTDRPQCKACHDEHIPLHPPGAPKKGPKPSVLQVLPTPPGAPKKGPKPVEPCSYAEKCTLFGCTKPHPPERPEPVNPASKPCSYAEKCTLFGCTKPHPPERPEPVDPATKPCKFGAACGKIGRAHV